MKRLVCLLGVTAVLVAIAGSPLALTPRRWSVAQNLTGTAPSVACNANEIANPRVTGLSLNGLRGFYLCVSPAAGQSLSGAGTLKAYFYDFSLAKWTRVPGADWTLTAAGAVDEPTCFPMQQYQEGNNATGGYGCAYYVPSGVTVSGGAQVTPSMTGVL